MEGIAGYITTVCAAALVCGIVRSLVEKKGPAGELIHMVCGVFLTVTAISPLLKLPIRDISGYVQTFQWDAQQVTAQAREDSRNAVNEIIIEKAGAYIMDKAASLHASVQVEFTLSEESPGVPCGAVISGKVSPYAKARLSQILQEELGIPREAQQWKTSG